MCLAGPRQNGKTLGLPVPQFSGLERMGGGVPGPAVEDIDGASLVSSFNKTRSPAQRQNGVPVLGRAEAVGEIERPGEKAACAGNVW